MARRNNKSPLHPAKHRAEGQMIRNRVRSIINTGKIAPTLPAGRQSLTFKLPIARSVQLLGPHQHRHDSWKLLQCDLPVMAPDQLHKYALENMACITTIMNRAGLLNGVIMLFLFSMGLETVSYEDRRGVLDILGKQQARNFPISGLFRRALFDAYAGQVTKRYTTVFIKPNRID